MNKPFKLTEVWAFVTTDPKTGEEGIPAIKVGELMMPLICGDRDRVASLIPKAKEVAKLSGFKIKLVRFHDNEVVAEDIKDMEEDDV